MSAPIQSGRALVRPLLIATAAAASLLLVACSAQTPGSATATATATSTSTVASATSTSSSSSDAPPRGSASGDVADVRVFADPIGEIDTAAEFAAYLLPGMSGPGVECATAHLDPDPVLNLSLSDGATMVSDLVVGCIEPAGIGELVAMYAVGFSEDGAQRYTDLAACASAAFDTASGSDVGQHLRDIYTARLDLAAPATSPDIAAGILTDEYGCGSEPEVPTGETEEPTGEASSPAGAAAGERSVDWTLLQAGDCIPTLPPDGQNSVLVGDCATPHEAEVIGRTLAISGTEQSSCTGMFESYIGSSYDATTWLDLTYYTSTDTFTDPTLICLVHSADGTLLTGSVKAA